MSEGRPMGISLRRTEENSAAIDALADRVGGRVPLTGLLGDLNRRARRTWAPGRYVCRALTWDVQDRRDPIWWPQGITSSADADPSGLVEGRRLLVVSWYSKGDHGVRLSFLDLDTRRYRHVLLVEPSLSGGEPAIAPVKAHAGGIVWHGPYLHVAATAKGILTCRVDDLMRVPDDSMQTHGYRYLLPVRFRHVAETAEGHERFRYSFLSLDRSGETPSLVAGEYGNRKQTRRLTRFELDPSTALLHAGKDASAPTFVHEGGVPRMQGAVRVDGQFVVSTSHGPWTPGSLWTGEPGAQRQHRWTVPMGPEDLSYWPQTGEIWCATEHPRRRWLVSVPADRLG